ncbi:hypothetical protein CEP54_009324 [Fusarium duplospermum]|uniref:Uncharacterized protein n=1 Tax=Fusarium duplospermum TaxID=1325734 RepID=A0A428PRC3_9HYPO|nr:hypothetical protein CEP54_009324 [Fusarium duplospermum]
MATAVPTNIDPWSVSAPYENSTYDLQNVISRKWVDSPNIRGTLDILQSCVLTLVACIYTALHLDVPTKTKWHRILISKVKWSLITLFAPEIALYMAADQLIEAWSLRRELRRLREMQGNAPKDFDIDLTYAFFVVMGGVRIDVKDLVSWPDLDFVSRWGVGSLPREDAEGRGTTTVRVSSTTVLWLAGHGHWIKIPRAKITDKSKADTFQKILVLIQVSWMIMQCIARLINKLPLTLLEIHTMVHVVCAIGLYGFWFKKPLNIQDPEVINPDVEGFDGEIALLLQRQYYTTISANLSLLDPNEPLPDNCNEPLRWVELEPGAQMSTGDALPIGLALYVVPEAQDEDYPENLLAVQPEDDLRFGITEEFYNRWEAILNTFGHKRNYGIMRCTDFIDAASKNQDDKDIFEWELRRMPFSEGKRNFNIDFTTFRGMSAKDLNDEFDELFSSYGILLGLAVFLSALYGGIHLSAWNWVFPTAWESLVWKFACVTIAAVLPLYHIFNKIRVNAFALHDGLETTMHVVLVLTLVIYMLARIYVIVEAFASLRYVPIGVYMAPVWVQMFPHF